MRKLYWHVVKNDAEVDKIGPWVNTMNGQLCWALSAITTIVMPLATGVTLSWRASEVGIVYTLINIIVTIVVLYLSLQIFALGRKIAHVDTLVGA